MTPSPKSSMSTPSLAPNSYIDQQQTLPSISTSSSLCSSKNRPLSDKQQRRLQANTALSPTKQLEDATKLSAATLDQLRTLEHEYQSSQLSGMNLSMHTPPKKGSSRRGTDIEFATEIGQGLLIEVRKLQMLLQQKDQMLKDVLERKADLERDADMMVKQLRQREEMQEQLKNQTWDLELAKQDLSGNVTELQQSLNRSHVEQSRLTKQLNDVRAELDRIRDREEKLNATIETIKTRHEHDMGVVRRHAASLQREKADTKKQMDYVYSELAIARAQSRMMARPENLPQINPSSYIKPTLLSSTTTATKPAIAAEMSKGTDKKSDGEQAGSLGSNKGSNGGQTLEVETLKSSLAHAHRMVSNLRSNLHKEKTEKFELKKLLSESQETIEQLQNEMWVDQPTPRRPAAAITGSGSVSTTTSAGLLASGTGGQVTQGSSRRRRVRRRIRKPVRFETGGDGDDDSEGQNEEEEEEVWSEGSFEESDDGMRTPPPLATYQQQSLSEQLSLADQLRPFTPTKIDQAIQTDEVVVKEDLPTITTKLHQPAAFTSTVANTTKSLSALDQGLGVQTQEASTNNESTLSTDATKEIHTTTDGAMTSLLEQENLVGICLKNSAFAPEFKYQGSNVISVSQQCEVLTVEPKGAETDFITTEEQSATKTAENNATVPFINSPTLDLKAPASEDPIPTLIALLRQESVRHDKSAESRHRIASEDTLIDLYIPAILDLLYRYAAGDVPEPRSKPKKQEIVTTSTNSGPSMDSRTAISPVQTGDKMSLSQSHVDEQTLESPKPASPADRIVETFEHSEAGSKIDFKVSDKEFIHGEPLLIDRADDPVNTARLLRDANLTPTSTSAKPKVLEAVSLQNTGGGDIRTTSQAIPADLTSPRKEEEFKDNALEITVSAAPVSVQRATGVRQAIDLADKLQSVKPEKRDASFVMSQPVKETLNILSINVCQGSTILETSSAGAMLSTPLLDHMELALDPNQHSTVNDGLHLDAYEAVSVIEGGGSQMDTDGSAAYTRSSVLVSPSSPAGPFSTAVQGTLQTSPGPVLSTEVMSSESTAPVETERQEVSIQGWVVVDEAPKLDMGVSQDHRGVAETSTGVVEVMTEKPEAQASTITTLSTVTDTQTDKILHSQEADCAPELKSIPVIVTQEKEAFVPIETILLSDEAVTLTSGEPGANISQEPASIMSVLITESERPPYQTASPSHIGSAVQHPAVAAENTDKDAATRPAQPIENPLLSLTPICSAEQVSKVSTARPAPMCTAKQVSDKPLVHMNVTESIPASSVASVSGTQTAPEAPVKLGQFIQPSAYGLPSERATNETVSASSNNIDTSRTSSGHPRSPPCQVVNSTAPIITSDLQDRGASASTHIHHQHQHQHQRRIVTEPRISTTLGTETTLSAHAVPTEFDVQIKKKATTPISVQLDRALPSSSVASQARASASEEQDLSVTDLSVGGTRQPDTTTMQQQRPSSAATQESAKYGHAVRFQEAKILTQSEADAMVAAAVAACSRKSTQRPPPTLVLPDDNNFTTGAGGQESEPSYGIAHMTPHILVHRPRRESDSSDISSLTERHASSQLGVQPGNSAIALITQTMIGNYMWKYTRKAVGQGLSERRHQRFFWIHPYTRTLYWSVDAPGAHGREAKAKSALIESVTIIPTPHPDHLHIVSLLIKTTGRPIKITAPDTATHDVWYEALLYLLERSENDMDVDRMEVAESLSNSAISSLRKPPLRNARSTGSLAGTMARRRAAARNFRS